MDIARAMDAKRHRLFNICTAAWAGMEGENRCTGRPQRFTYHRVCRVQVFNDVAHIQ
jgi:hypothetical protein